MPTSDAQPSSPQFKDFITVLGNLLGCGLLDVVCRAITQHRDWFDSLKSADFERGRALRKRLAVMREIEMMHGPGCLLDLGHPTVIAMIKWQRIDAEMVGNARKFIAADHYK